LGERREGHEAGERMEIHAQSFLISMLDDYCHKSRAYPKDSWPHMMFVSQALLLGPYIEAPEVPHHQQDPLLHQSEGVILLAPGTAYEDLRKKNQFGLRRKLIRNLPFPLCLNTLVSIGILLMILREELFTNALINFEFALAT